MMVKKPLPIYSALMAGRFLGKTYGALVALGGIVGHVVLLMVRLYWGASLLLIGWGKLQNVTQVATFFATLHIPMPGAAVILVACLEILGGASLFLGLFSRVMSFLLILLFWVAYFTAHHEALVHVTSNPALFFAQEAFLYLYAATLVFSFGAGAVSFDYWLEKKRTRM